MNPQMQRLFSNSLRLSLSHKFTRIDAQQSGETYHMQINLIKPATLSFTKDTTLDYFSTQLTESGASEVSFYTMNGAAIPLCERVSDL